MKFAVPVVVILVGAAAGCDDGNRSDELQPPTGVGETIFTLGEDPTNPFFAELGSNQRTCASCHDQEAGWSVTPTELQARFDASEGLDPIFRALDGATSPAADVSTVEARRLAYRLLLERALIRVGLPVPEGAEFELTAVADPHGFATANELSLFRRPLPATNLRFVPQIMWDGREPTLDLQAADATMGHAQAEVIDDQAIARAVEFESSLFTAQALDFVAGELDSDGARGGPATLLDQAFEPGINDSQLPGFDRDVFTLYAAWLDADTSTAEGARRAAIARGEQVFNTRTFRIRGVAGLPDQDGTCSTCHDTPNLGNHSSARPMDIGVSDEDRRFDGMPLYTLTNLADGRVVRTTDPGLALVTGRWDDIGRFKVPVLRGLAMRPPYFHNGIALNLGDVLRFYQRRFDTNFSRGERADLEAFLSAL